MCYSIDRGRALAAGRLSMQFTRDSSGNSGTFLSLADKHYTDYNKLRKPRVKQHTTTLVSSGIAINFMNAFLFLFGACLPRF